MKKTLSFFYFIVAAAATSINVYAKDLMVNISSVTPIYSSRVQNQQVCDVTFSDQSQPAGAVNPGSVIGGIAGALLGSQVGGGNGRLAMTALGAITGAMSGDRVVQQQRTAQPQQSCRWVQRSEQYISSYRVTYEYDGETFQSNLPYDPSRGGEVKVVPVKTSLSMQ